MMSLAAAAHYSFEVLIKARLAVLAREANKSAPSTWQFARAGPKLGKAGYRGLKNQIGP